MDATAVDQSRAPGPLANLRAMRIMLFQNQIHLQLGIARVWFKPLLQPPQDQLCLMAFAHKDDPIWLDQQLAHGIIGIGIQVLHIQRIHAVLLLRRCLY